MRPAGASALSDLVSVPVSSEIFSSIKRDGAGAFKTNLPVELPQACVTPPSFTYGRTLGGLIKMLPTTAELGRFENRFYPVVALD